MYEDIAQSFMDYAQQSQSGKYKEDHQYPRRYLDWITLTAKHFFEKHPHLLTNEVIETIATGDKTEKIEQFGHITEFHALNEALENYFNSVRPRTKKIFFWEFGQRLKRAGNKYKFFLKAYDTSQQTMQTEIKQS